jgi:hypothetical protein
MNGADGSGRLWPFGPLASPAGQALERPEACGFGPVKPSNVRDPAAFGNTCLSMDNFCG